MKTLVIKDNFAFIYLNKEIYSNTSVLTSISAYKDFLMASKTELGKYLTLKLETLTQEYSLEELTHEFLNYLLSVEKKQEAQINRGEK
jgi:hypothetical protein